MGISRDVSEPRREAVTGPLKFGIFCAGSVLPQEAYGALYDTPIATKTLHVIGMGNNDIGVEGSIKSLRVCEETRKQTLFRPGGHYIPRDKDVVNGITEFVQMFISFEV